MSALGLGCENARTLERDRRSYSSKPVLRLKLAKAFNFEDELKNAILVEFRSFAFSHSQGHERPLEGWPVASGLLR